MNYSETITPIVIFSRPSCLTIIHQGSVLSPLLYVIVMEIITSNSRGKRAGLPPELLYADDLILMPESKESLCEKTVQWKSGLDAKGLKMNTGKTKVMFG